MPDWVLRDLDEDTVAGLERELDAARLVARLDGVPVDFARVQHRIASAADVDERRLHAGQDVLHATEVDVADEGRILVAGDVVLDEDVVLEHGDLDAPVLRTHDHVAVDRLAACQELGLGDDGTPTTGLATVAATLLLGLQPRRALDALRFGDDLDGPGLTHADDRGGVLRLVRLFARTPTIATARRALRFAVAPLVGIVPVVPVVGLGAAAHGRWERHDLGRIEHQLGRCLRDENLGQQAQRDRGGQLRSGLRIRLEVGLRRRFGRFGRRRLGCEIFSTKTRNLVRRLPRIRILGASTRVLGARTRVLAARILWGRVIDRRARCIPRRGRFTERGSAFGFGRDTFVDGRRAFTRCVGPRGRQRRIGR